MLCIVCAIGANAQWTAPTAPTPSYDGTWATPTDGETYYIYNVGSGTFLGGGRNYGTRAVCTIENIWVDGDALITPSANKDYALPFTLEQVGESYRFHHNGTTKGDVNCMFYGGNDAWIDRAAGEQPDLWNIVSTDNGYRIDPSTKENTYWGVHATNLVSPTVAYTWSDFADANADKWIYWQFVPASDIDLIKSAIEDYKEAVNVYNSRLLLYNYYLKATDSGVSADAYEAVYENGDATAEELKEAAYALLADILAPADDDNPIEITDVVLTNADFSSGNIGGWETNYKSGVQADNIGYQGANYTNGDVTIDKFIEAWRWSPALGDGYLRQTVSGLPEGKYILECDAIAADQPGGTMPTGAYLYINAAGVDYKTTMATGNGQPEHFSCQFLSPGGVDVTFGMKTESTTANWIAADNFKVTYYGIDLSPYADMLANAVSGAQSIVEGTVPDGVYAELQSIVEANNIEWETSADYAAAISTIQAATASAKGIMESYARYVSMKNKILAFDSSIDTHIADRKVSNTTDDFIVYEAIASLRTAYMRKVVQMEIPEDPGYIDVTDMIIDNPTPTSNSNWWSVTNADGAEAAAYAFDPGNNNAEFYNQGGYSIMQTLASLPAGFYRLTAVAVTRDGMQSVLSANDNTMNIVTMPNSPADGVNGLNSRGNCKDFFDAGNGVNELTFGLDSEQPVTIGLTADNTANDHWTVWRSFSLAYIGKDASAIYGSVLLSAIANAKSTANELNVPAGIKNSLIAEAEKYETAMAGYTTEKEFTDAAAALKEAVNTAKAAVGPTAKIAVVLEKAKATAKIEKLGNEPKATLQGVINNTASALDACKTVAEIEALTSQIDVLWTAINDAIESIELTGDEAVDLTYLLTNPDLSIVPGWSKAEGWYCDQTQPTQNSQVMNTNQAVANTADPTKYAMYEYWSSNSEATEGFTVYQKVTLPVGTYKMEALACAGYGGEHRYGIGTDDGGKPGSVSSEDKKNISFSANDVDGTYITTPTLEPASLVFIQTETGEVKIGLKAHEGNTSNWMGIGYVQFYKVAPKAIEISENIDYTPASAAGDVKVKRTIKADTWNTLVLPFQVTNEELKAAFGNDVEVAEESEVASETGSTIIFKKMETPAIAPNKPVLLKTSTAGTEYTFKNRTVAAGEPVQSGTNFDFQGTYAASTTVAAGDYFLSADKLFQSKGETTVKGTRAYLKAKAGTDAAEVKVEFFIDGVATAIESIDADTDVQNGTVYNLAGQRVQKAQRGLYIVNGKKMLVK